MMIHQFSSYSTRMVLLYFLCVVNVVTAFKMPTGAKNIIVDTLFISILCDSQFIFGCELTFRRIRRMLWNNPMTSSLQPFISGCHFLRDTFEINLTISILIYNIKIIFIFAATLSCNGTGLSLSFNKTELDGAGSNYTISFNGSTDSNCQITGETSSNIQGDRIWIQANYDQCGIKVSEDNTTIVYNQIVVLNFQEAPNHPLIYRGKRDEYHIRCQKTRSFTQSASVFNVTKDAGSTINKGKN